MVKLFENLIIRLILQSFIITFCMGIIIIIVNNYLLVSILGFAELDPKGIATLFALTFLAVLGFAFMRMIREVFPIVTWLQSIAQPSTKSTLRKFTIGFFEDIERTISELLNPEGAYLDWNRANLIFEICFRYGGQNYVSTTNLVPSQFMNLCNNCLKLEEAYTKPLGKRILIIDEKVLNNDYTINRKKFAAFWNWHLSKKDELLIVDPEIASRVKNKKHLLFANTAIWRDRYALLYEASEGMNKFRMALVLKGEPRFDDLIDYFDSLMNYVKALKIEKEGIQTIPVSDYTRRLLLEEPRTSSGYRPLLAEHWEEFVDCPKRLEKLGPFFNDVLRPYRGGRVLDAAATIGCESIELAKQGFDVVSNEIDNELAEIIFEKSRKMELTEPLKITKFDWRTLGYEYKGEPFDVILVLGNAFSMLLESQDRIEALKQFRMVLRSGGILIIDERNFAHVLNLKKMGILRELPFKKTTMYPGEMIQEVPIAVGENEIIFEYNHRILGQLGTIKMYPFQEGELKHLLEVSGFKIVQTYSNLEKHYQNKEPPDFFTYVALKQ